MPTAPRDTKDILYIMFFLFVLGCIVYYIWIHPKKTIVENSKNVYNSSITKMNTTYGKARKDAEDSANESKKSWDKNVNSIYKIIIETTLFIIAIFFNLYNPFYNYENPLPLTMAANAVLLGMILFEYTSSVVDEYLKNTFNSIDSVLPKDEPEKTPSYDNTEPNKMLALFLTWGICICSLGAMSWYTDRIFIVYAVIAYILSLFTMFDVPGFSSNFYIFILFFIVNIPIVTLVTSRLNIDVPSQYNGIYIPLLIAFYMLTIIMLTTLGIVDLYDNQNVYIILSLIGLSFLFYAKSLTSSIYQTFLFVISMIILFIVTLHYIVVQQNWILYMFLYTLVIGIVLYIAPVPAAVNALGNIQPIAQITTKEITLLSAEVIFILIYIYIRSVNKSVYTQHGEQIVNNPVTLKDLTNIKVKNKPMYDYGISFWFFIEAMNPSFGPQATEYTTILSYEGKPNVSYNGTLNTIQIEIKTESKNIKVDVIKSVPLQKWNHIVINYVNGVCDIFMNGELHSSKTDVIPIKDAKYMDIGATDGILGSICNVILFHQQITSSNIKNLYNQFSEKSPPVI